MAEENLLKRSRSTTDDKSIAVSSLSSGCVEEALQDIEPRKKKPHITGIKKLSRYDPGVSMTKDELKAWRKEARRVRNRESAEASRKKNRESVQKLETEVEDMKIKYAAALKYIIDLEDKQQRNNKASSPPTVVRQDLEDCRKELLSLSYDRHVSQLSSSDVEVMAPAQISSTPLSLSCVCENSVPFKKGDKNIANIALSIHDYHKSTSRPSQQKHIINNVISRPIACV